MASNKVETGIWLPAPNQAVRVIIGYEGKWRPIFRFKVGRDGSIYLGHRFKKLSTLLKGTARSEGGQIRFLYHEGETVETDALADPDNTSFHPSGIINFADIRTDGYPFKELVSRQLLAHVLFRHPSIYEPDGIRILSDVVLNYPISETKPMVGRITVAPAIKDKIEPLLISGIEYQLSLVFHYFGVGEIPDLEFRFDLYHGPDGPWPPYDVLAFPSFGSNS